MTCELPCVDFLLRDRVQDPPKRKEVVGRWVVFSLVLGSFLS